MTRVVFRNLARAVSLVGLAVRLLPELTGEFASSTELSLRLEADGPAYVLTKRE